MIATRVGRSRALDDHDAAAAEAGVLNRGAVLEELDYSLGHGVGHGASDGHVVARGHAQVHIAPVREAVEARLRQSRWVRGETARTWKQGTGRLLNDSSGRLGVTGCAIKNTSLGFVLFFFSE